MRINVKTAIALTAALGLTPLAHAAPVNWDVDAAGSWGDNGNWDVVPAWDGSDDIRLTWTDTNGVTSSRTLTIDGDRVINSLYAADLRTPNASNAGWTFTVNPGSPADSKLTILSGNITSDNLGKGSGSNDSRPLNLQNTLVQIGDGVTAVTDAVWHINNSLLSGDPGSNGSKTTRLTMGEITGIAGTAVSVTGVTSQGGTATNRLELTKASTNFFGTITNTSDRLLVLGNTSNALGSGVLEHNGGSNFAIGFLGLENEQAAEIRLLVGGTRIYNTTADAVTTLNGNLTGAGNVVFNRAAFGSTTRYSNTVVINGANNTLSGNVGLESGTVRVDGVWTGAGNVTQTRGFFEGVGSLGLASDKNVNITGDSGFLATVAPGTNGTIGTLTLGTDNTNTVAFNIRSVLSIDIDGAAADMLIVNGNLNLTNAENTLEFNLLNAPASSFYTLVTYTGTLTGEFSNVVGLPEGYELDYSTLGQINLIPETASIALLGLGGLLMLGRRRN